MGVNVCVRTLEGDDHPTWDWSRYSGDSEMANVLCAAPVVQQQSRWDEFSFVSRPVDVEAFRTRLLAANVDNHERWNELCDILRDQPEYHLYFSL